MAQTKQAIVNRLRAKLLEVPGAQQGFVRLYICEAELYRRIIEKVPKYQIDKAVKSIIKDLRNEGVVSWLGGES